MLHRFSMDDLYEMMAANRVYSEMMDEAAKDEKHHSAHGA